MPAVTRHIGLSLGADICWPLAFEQILADARLELKVGKDVVRFACERTTLEPFMLQPGCKDEPPAAEPPSICVRQPYARFQGDAPFREPSVEVLEDSGADASWWRARCRRCGTTWMVAYIPGGGIYGDFGWDREEAEP